MSIAARQNEISMMLLETLQILLAIVPIAEMKLLRINEWYTITLPPGRTASIDINLFKSCDSFSFVIDSSHPFYSQFDFTFDGTQIEKIDISSEGRRTVPETKRVIDGCRDRDRKPIMFNITSSYSYFELRVDGQVIRRPKQRYDEEFKLLLPQELPCCVIRALLSTDKPEPEAPVPVYRTTLSPFYTRPVHPMVTTILATTKHRRHDTREPTPVPTTSSHEYQLGNSWTELVNREWSITFLICAYTIGFLMASLSLFGFCMFLYLLTKPKQAGKLYAVETPTLGY